MRITRYNQMEKVDILRKLMARGRPGGNPNIKEHGFKTDREHPLTQQTTFRIDEPTKAALKAGKLPNWQEVCRQALKKALAEIEENEELCDQDLKSA